MPDEGIKELYERRQEQFSRTRQIIFETQKGNIRERRNLIQFYVTISSAVIGFTIPIFGKSSLIRHQKVLIAALVLLAMEVGLSLFYLTYVLAREARETEVARQRFEKHVENDEPLWAEFFRTADKGKLAKDLKDKAIEFNQNLKKTSPKIPNILVHFHWVLFVVFISALLLIAGSLI